MNEASKQAALSALRSLLVAAGSALAARGYIDSGTVSEIVGAIMVLVPLAWGIWDKYIAERKTKAREAVAVNVGIVVADATPGKTPPVSAADAEAVITRVAPAVADLTEGMKP